MKHPILLTCSLLATLLLQACAAPGPAFTQLEPVPADKGHLYLYRQSALYGVAARYKVRAADDTLLGELSNASYLLLPLAPGAQRITVDEAARIVEKACELTVRPGQNQFFEYDSSAGLLLGWGALSRCVERGEAEALPALKQLNRAN